MLSYLACGRRMFDASNGLWVPACAGTTVFLLVVLKRYRRNQAPVEYINDLR